MDYQYDYSTTSDLSAGGGIGIALFIVFYFAFIFGFYIYFSAALQAIAKKLGSPNSWWAWVPILSALQVIEIAKKPMWWIVLLFIPFVNIVVGVLIWMSIVKQFGKPDIYGILMIIAPINLILIGMLAWGKTDTMSTPVLQTTQQ
jgi:hypothetical protein